MPHLLGGIEAGGTKFVCVVGYASGEILERERFETRTPDVTLADVIAFFRTAEARRGAIAAFGIASFGPLDLDRQSATFGSIMRTPKAHWGRTNLMAPLRAAFSRPVAIDTDVNGAAVAESRWGAGVGHRTVVYVTAGTGIGGGIAVDGNCVPALIHPEMGHLRVPRHPYDHDFHGICPFHSDCIEGLASGPAVVARWGQRLEQLPAGHPARQIIGFYLGQLCASIALLISPSLIVLGGGLMSDGSLFPLIRAAAREQLAGYLQHSRLGDTFEKFIVSPALRDSAGAMGALALAEHARLGH